MTSLSQVVTYTNHKRRKLAQNKTYFNELIESPLDLGSVSPNNDLDEITLPANCRLAFSFNAALDSGEITFTSNNRIVGNSGGPANKLFHLGYFEKGKKPVFNINTGCPTGDLSLYLLDEWNNKSVIAIGEVV